MSNARNSDFGYLLKPTPDIELVALREERASSMNLYFALAAGLLVAFLVIGAFILFPPVGLPIGAMVITAVFSAFFGGVTVAGLSLYFGIGRFIARLTDPFSDDVTSDNPAKILQTREKTTNDYDVKSQLTFGKSVDPAEKSHSPSDLFSRDNGISNDTADRSRAPDQKNDDTAATSQSPGSSGLSP